MSRGDPSPDFPLVEACGARPLTRAPEICRVVFCVVVVLAECSVCRMATSASLFVCPAVDGHLGGFLILAIIGGKILEFQLTLCISTQSC